MKKSSIKSKFLNQLHSHFIDAYFVSEFVFVEYTHTWSIFSIIVQAKSITFAFQYSHMKQPGYVTGDSFKHVVPVDLLGIFDESLYIKNIDFSHLFNDEF